MRSVANQTVDPCGAGASSKKVIPIDIAAAKAVAAAKPITEAEQVSLAEASGRILALKVTAGLDLPLFDNSAMDGYAVRLAELPGGGPWVCNVVGRVAAGQHFVPPVGNAGAVRVFTGAPIPAGFDAVVMQERCERFGDRIVLSYRPRPYENIRRAGEDVRAGAVILHAGDYLTPQRLALAAAQGADRIDIVRKVRIGLISTGSELREPGEFLAPGQIYNSNRIMLRSMMSFCSWIELVDFGIVPDDRKTLAETFGTAAQRCDALVTTGGVSAGDEDHVVNAMADLGGELEVLKVAMRPGKPVKVGMIGNMFFTGLPGNPNAALVTFRQIAFPAFRTLAGLKNVMPDWQPSVAGFTYRKTIGRTEFVPVRIAGHDNTGLPIVEMLERGSSASLMAMALADGIAMLPPEIGLIEPGIALSIEAFTRR